MAVETLTPMVVSALVPYLAGGAERLVDKTIDEGFEKRGRIWQLVKGLFVKDDLITLNLFEKNPTDIEKQAGLRGELKRLLKKNPIVVDELEELLKLLEIITNSKTNTINQRGNNNIAVQDSNNSKITINRK